MSKVYDALIIGGGAAGLFLASQLDGRVSCALLECNARVGKKLLVTGNGKCNLSAYPLDYAKYNDAQFAKSVISSFDFERTTAAFEKMGLLVKNMDGRIYPYSESAATVLEALRRGVEERGTELKLSHLVTDIKRAGESFEVSGIMTPAEDGAAHGVIGGSHGRRALPFTLNCKRVVLACGSDADFGTDSVSLYEKAFGHTSAPRRPSLVPLRTEREAIKGLDGVRAKVALNLGSRREQGEILFKNFGVSGIATLNVSALIARGVSAGEKLGIDFMPDYDEAQIAALLSRRCGAYDALTGILHSRIAARLLAAAKVDVDSPACDSADKLAHIIKHYDVAIEGLGDKSLAQVMSGGLRTEEFDCHMRSKLSLDAYAVGEAVNIDGECGGYNLQWAWSSAGVVADDINESALKG